MKTWVETDANGRKYITSEPRLHLPPRQWQGLTLADIDDLEVGRDWIAGARWAEAKLKEKNT